MFDKVKCLESSEKNVWKYIFEKKDAITEAVLYKYKSFEERTVICCSVQSGCPVGCKFCGTGKKFIRNLTAAEIISQITHILKDKGIEDVDCKSERFQIMFMSMGEPLLNFNEVWKSLAQLSKDYPNAELLLSIIGINDNKVLGELLCASSIKKVGLQFSIHQADEEKRNDLIPFKNKMSLREIRDYGLIWSEKTKRPVYLNYCIDGSNTSDDELNRLKDLFNPISFRFTFSVVCSYDETMKDAGYKNHDELKRVMNEFVNDGYNVRMFDPAGQDDIGGGCGQLWHVQEWMNNHE